MKKLVFVVLAVFGLVSVSFAYKLNETQESRVEYFKAVVAELEDLKEQGKLPYEGKVLYAKENCFWSLLKS